MTFRHQRAFSCISHVLVMLCLCMTTWSQTSFRYHKLSLDLQYFRLECDRLTLMEGMLMTTASLQTLKSPFFRWEKVFIKVYSREVSLSGLLHDDRGIDRLDVLSSPLFVSSLLYHHSLLRATILYVVILFSQFSSLLYNNCPVNWPQDC